MADTKSLDKTMRKGVKRSQRAELKEAYRALKPKDRKKFNNAEEKIGLKAFIAAQTAEE